jgi:hypothetical protein
MEGKQGVQGSYNAKANRSVAEELKAFGKAWVDDMVQLYVYSENERAKVEKLLREQS